MPAISEVFRNTDLLIESFKRRSQADLLLPPSSGWRATYGSSADKHDDERTLQFYASWPYAAIRPIATRVAGQPLQVGRVLKPPKAKHYVPRPGARLATIAEKARMPLHVRCMAGLPLGGTESQRIQQMLTKTMHADSAEIEILESHPFLECVSDPNQRQIQHDLIYMTIAGLQMTAKSYWWIVNSGRRKGYDLWPLPSTWVGQKATGHLDADYQITAPSAPADPIDVKYGRMVFFHLPDPADPFGSVAPAKAAHRAIVTDDSIQESQKSGFDNDMVPGLAIILGEVAAGPDGKMSRPELERWQAEQIEQRLDQLYRRPGKHRKMILLDRMIKDVKRISMGNTEMDWKESADMIKKRILQIFGVNSIIMGDNEDANRACHDLQTELLTRRGWLRYDEIELTDEAATMNADGNFEWQQIEKIHVHDYDGDMVCLRGSKLDISVTPEHRMWKTQHVQDLKPYRRGGKTAVIRNRPWAFSRADELKYHDMLPIATKEHEAEVADWFIVPGVVVNHGGVNGVRVVTPDLRVPANPFLSFLGWFVSEGWTSPDKRYGKRNSPGYGVSVRQAVGGVAECDAIESSFNEALPTLTLHHSYHDAIAAEDTKDGYARQESITWIVTDKRLWTWLRMNCGTKAENKRLPDFVFDLPGSQLSLLLDAMLLGDGHHRTEKSAVYFTKSKELANQVQTIALLCGRTARICKTMKNEIIPVVVVKESARVGVWRKMSKVPYSGKVWCVTVPNGLIITRRNGKPIVSGNSSVVAQEGFLANVVNPLINLLSQVMQDSLLPYFAEEEEGLVCWIEEASVEDPDTKRADIDSLFNSSALTINEKRAQFGKSPFKGGDVIAVPNTTKFLDPEEDLIKASAPPAPVPGGPPMDGKPAFGKPKPPGKKPPAEEADETDEGSEEGEDEANPTDDEKRIAYFTKAITESVETVREMSVTAMQHVSVVTQNAMFSLTNVLGTVVNSKAFCPTGPGGGIDPSCSGGGTAVLDKPESANLRLSDESRAFRQASPEAFIEARNRSTRMGFLSHLEPSDLEDHKLLVNSNATVGVAIDKHGDIQNVFNNGGGKGAAAKAMAAAIDSGGRTLDCYDGFLNHYYHQFGFEETGRMKFNPEFANPGWDMAKDGHPDVVFMAWKGYPEGGREAAIERANNRDSWNKHEPSMEYTDDFDAGKARSRESTLSRRAANYQGSRAHGRPEAHGSGNQSGVGAGTRDRGTVADSEGAADLLWRAESALIDAKQRGDRDEIALAARKMSLALKVARRFV